MKDKTIYGVIVQVLPSIEETIKMSKWKFIKTCKKNLANLLEVADTCEGYIGFDLDSMTVCFDTENNAKIGMNIIRSKNFNTSYVMPGERFERRKV